MADFYGVAKYDFIYVLNLKIDLIDKFLSPTPPLYNNSALFQPPLPLDDFSLVQRSDAQGFSYQGVYASIWRHVNLS
ncbi:hypothetical protein WR25_06141 [Diploscapter pachys]|uniref:Uncharacterized protein n=1 Tax=Diploscapter pachys TaxID=2018661 RepID=A0A2A2JAS8_9BILA|nr:hypothetical protein WR25_06141 [Diploscapter pachys]